ncbi:MAG: hypothetical protein NC082_09695 [Clostridiales bacterium]|nr:hypothetical protein [Clostridiales bacterium]
MNGILTLDILAKKLSIAANIDVAQAKEYILLVQQSVTQRLVDGQENITVPHLGTFSLTDSPSNPVAFTPVNEMAEEVNEPFAFFEPEELYEEPQPSVETQPTEEPQSETDARQVAEHTIVSETETATKPETASQSVDNTDTESNHTVGVVPPVYRYTVPDNADATTTDTDDTSVADSANQQSVTPAELDTISSDASVTGNSPTIDSYSTPVYVEEDSEGDYDETTKKPNRLSPPVSFILGVLTGMLLTCVAVFFLYPPLYSGEDDIYIPENEEMLEPTATTEQITTDAVDPAPEDTNIKGTTTVATPESAPTGTPAPKTVTKTATKDDNSPLGTETVGRRNYLATMSRKYYGRMEFWVYIYKENEDKLGHPDRIPSGTVVTIPSKAKYGIDANDPESIARAKKLSEQIQARYK